MNLHVLLSSRIHEDVMKNEEKLKAVILAIYEYIKIRSIKSTINYNPFMDSSLEGLWDHEINNIMEKLGNELNIIELVYEPRLEPNDEDVYDGQGHYYDNISSLYGEYGFNIKDEFFEFIRRYNINENTDFYSKIRANKIDAVAPVENSSNVKSISWNKELWQLQIDSYAPISIKKNSREGDILNALISSSGIKRRTPITYDEILEKIDNDSSIAKKLSKALYQASRRLNLKIELLTGIPDFFLYDTHEVSVNLNCF